MSGTGESVANYFKEKKAQGDPILAINQDVSFRNGKEQGENTLEVIDVLVIGKKEIYIVKTQDTFSFQGSFRESSEPLKKFFEKAEAYVKEEFDVQNKEVKSLFVTDELSFIFF